MLLEGYKLVTFTESWWEESHEGVAIDGCRLLRKDRQRSLWIALYIRNEWIVKGSL